MVNSVTLIGRLGSDPELKTTNTGKNVCNASVATSEKWGDQEKTTWHRVVAWGKVAEFMSQYSRKGGLIYVQGSIQNREYTDKEGVKRQITEILVNQFRSLSSPSGGGKPKQEQGAQGSEGGAGGFTEEDIPF